ncbi:unnamed protein product [Diatraea saccharalis]|uniref:Uncharacterized protein n=1 Tax=Diatraea saccharalis TaxID=40085 RepID=A0A9N9N1N3_9NEOP|nr:unnamed protein product [Diatraea saccharalis]
MSSFLRDCFKEHLDVSRSIFRDEFPEGLEQQARFAWTEEDGNIASLVSEPGFGTTGQTTFGKDLDAALKCEMKAHREDGCSPVNPRPRHAARMGRSLLMTQPETPARTQTENCEVTSSVGPYLPSIEVPSSSDWHKAWDPTKTYQDPNTTWNENPWSAMGSGVIVDPIKTYHMGVALATRQTPFALLKPNNSTPVLVKVIDTKLPGGKQMLVPATAEDLKVGGKIVLQNDENASAQVLFSTLLLRELDYGSITSAYCYIHIYLANKTFSKGPNTEPAADIDGAVQIRVPVVAIVVPKIKSGGRLHLSVEEPHHAYHTALSADVGEVKVEPCATPVPMRRADPTCDFDDNAIRPERMSSCALPPPAPSPPLDLISMDLFEPMECIPMGPQITAVDNIDHPPHSDDSDIFIGEFEVS